jgi:hypothetical protein
MLSTTNRMGITLHSAIIPATSPKGILSYSAAIILALAGTFSCSTIDPTADVGTAILRAQDSTLTDFNLNFRPIRTKLSILKFSSFLDTSLAARLLSPAVHPLSDTAYLGTWWNELSTVYMEVSGNTMVAKLRALDSLKDTISSMSFRFYAEKADTILARNILTRFTPAKLHSDPINRFGSRFAPFTLDSIDTAGALYYNIGILRYDSLSAVANIDHYTPKDTVFIKNAAGDSIIGKNILQDTTLPIYKNLAFMAAYDGAILQLPPFGTKKVAIGITYRIPTMNHDTTEYIPINYRDYTVQSIGADLGTMATAAITDNAIGRTAVIAIDLRPLWKLMSDTLRKQEFRNILQAQFTLSIDSADSRNNEVVLKYILKDTLFSSLSFTVNQTIPTSTLIRDTLTKSFPTQVVLTPTNLNDFVAVHPDTGYLYGLPASNSFQKTVWGHNASSADSVEIEAVFSNPVRNKPAQ